MDGGTFRDPCGSLFDVQDTILRLIHPTHAADFEALIGHDVVTRLVESGSVIATRRLDRDAVPERLRGLRGTWFGHERIPFVSVPAEWCPAMLAQAALHTLEVNEELIRHGLVLKDATPANILFSGSRPVFVDMPSIERLESERDIWLARHQFETTFLLPLVANLEAGLPLRWTLADPAVGLSHEQLARTFGPRRWWGPARIRNVALPAALSGRWLDVNAKNGARAKSTGRSAGGLAKTQYVLGRSMASLRTAVKALAARIEGRQSHWSGYAAARSHYPETDLAKKRSFVGQVLERSRPSWLIDVGANTGEFSELSATASNVVAIDLDEVSVDAIFARASAGKRPIQPLVVNLAQPTPASGWKYGERKSFLDRAHGRFQLALMLAVGHHLRVSGGVPLAEILDLGMSLGRGSLLFEFVPTTDPMFRAIARGREALYADNTRQNCEALLAARGQIELHQELSNGRVLFWIRRA